MRLEGAFDTRDEAGRGCVLLHSGETKRNVIQTTTTFVHEMEIQFAFFIN